MEKETLKSQLSNDSESFDRYYADDVLKIINGLESEIKTLREENAKMKEVNNVLYSQINNLYKPAYERHIKEIEELKSKLLEKDKKIKEAWFAGEKRGHEFMETQIPGGPDLIEAPNWEQWAKENNITITE